MPRGLAASICIVALVGEVAAQRADVAIRGRVVDEAGAPVAGAVVMLGTGGR